MASSGIFDTAFLFVNLGDKAEALRTLRKAIEAGYKETLLLNGFLDNKDGVIELAGTPEYEAVKRMVEQIEAQFSNR